MISKALPAVAEQQDRQEASFAETGAPEPVYESQRLPPGREVKRKDGGLGWGVGSGDQRSKPIFLLPKFSSACPCRHNALVEGILLRNRTSEEE